MCASVLQVCPYDYNRIKFVLREVRLRSDNHSKVGCWCNFNYNICIFGFFISWSYYCQHWKRTVRESHQLRKRYNGILLFVMECVAKYSLSGFSHCPTMSFSYRNCLPQDSLYMYSLTMLLDSE